MESYYHNSAPHFGQEAHTVAELVAAIHNGPHKGQADLPLGELKEGMRI
jgi:hypothetical protein